MMTQAQRTLYALLGIVSLFVTTTGVVQAGDAPKKVSVAKVKVCHIPPGNEENFHTITISANALQSHLDHGDFLGECTEQACAPLNAPCTADHPEVCCTGLCNPVIPGLTGCCAPQGAPCDLSNPGACCSLICFAVGGCG
jgi:hypothetical protein